jgi:hypothetical protein
LNVKRQGCPHEKAAGHARFGVRNGLVMVALAILVVVNLIWSESPSPKRKPVHETRMSALERLEYERSGTGPSVWAVSAGAFEQNH